MSARPTADVSRKILRTKHAHAQLCVHRRGQNGRRLPTCLSVSVARETTSNLDQLGLGAASTRLAPTHNPLLSDVGGGVVSVSAGANHSVCAMASGLVMSWGHAEYNQQGVAGDCFPSSISSVCWCACVCACAYSCVCVRVLVRAVFVGLVLVEGFVPVRRG